MKRNETFRSASTGLDHALVVACGLTQILGVVRLKEHLNLDKPTGVGEHCLITGHSVSKNNVRVLSREQEWHRRKVKKAINIKQQGPIMIRDTNCPPPPHLQPHRSGKFRQYLGHDLCVVMTCRCRSKRRTFCFKLRSNVS